MEIIQEIGSYAGFAAVLGLAVLSALYFSQARDVKRLREWAGRAPERVPSPVQTQRVVAQPIAKPAQPPGGAQKAMPPVPRPPGAQPGVAIPATPAAAQAAAAGAAPAVAKGPAPATPAGTSSTEVDGDDEEAADSPDVTTMDTVVHPPPQPPDGVSREDADGEQLEDGAGDGDDAVAANGAVAAGTDDEPSEEREADRSEPDAVDELDEDTGEWSPEDEHSELDLTDEHDVLPATPAAGAGRLPQPPRPFPRRGTPAPRYERGERTPIIPPYSESRPGSEGGDGAGGHGRRPLLIALAALVVVAIGAFAVLQVVAGDDDSSDGGGLSAGQTTDAGKGGNGGGGGGTPAIDPSQVTVAVLNGTTVPGLAATLGDKIAGEGFQLGTVTNNFDQERAESVVLYAPGAEDEATAVARQLDITQREPIDPDSQGLAGDATVVVVAGADQNQ
jgi:LytR cell envelope-related transcriptional attenuator